MNRAEIKSQASKLKAQLETITFDNFAYNNPRTSIPESHSSLYSEFNNQFQILCREALQAFPETGIERLLEESKRLLDPSLTRITADKFEQGKQTILKSLNIIEKNAAEEKKVDFTPMEKPLANINRRVFISYYSEQILEQIKTVFDTLDQIDSDLDILEEDSLVARKQSSNLDTVASRIDEIRNCSCAIICLQSSDSSDYFPNMAYFDLGACMAVFPLKIIIIYEGDNLPDSLKGKVDTFNFLGNLDFRKGMELAGKIGRLFK